MWKKCACTTYPKASVKFPLNLQLFDLIRSFFSVTFFLFPVRWNEKKLIWRYAHIHNNNDEVEKKKERNRWKEKCAQIEHTYKHIQAAHTNGRQYNLRILHTTDFYSSFHRVPCETLWWDWQNRMRKTFLTVFCTRTTIADKGCDCNCSRCRYISLRVYETWWISYQCGRFPLLRFFRCCFG